MTTQDPRSQSDEQFLKDCRVETYRGPGPGGQKRNKTSSAVRITHRPTDLHATAAESRSQSQNRTIALRRLRLRLAIEVRRPVDPETFTLPDWFSASLAPRNPNYPPAIGLLLDVLAAFDWTTAPARPLLKLNSRELTALLFSAPEASALVNRERASRGLRPLTHD
jgi:hypothetical protein